MKIVVLCKDEPRHIYFANKMQDASTVMGIVVQRKYSFSRQLFKFPSTKRKINESWRYLRQKAFRKIHKEQRFFFSENYSKLSYRGKFLEVFDINDNKVKNIIIQTNPDLVLTFGCGILKRNVFFETPKFGVVNIHSGIVPDYRGVDNVYWCLYNNEPNKIGATIHYIDRGIDTGEILAQTYPPIVPNDNELSLFNKTIMCGIKLFTEVLNGFDKIDGRLTGKKQPYCRKLYQEKNRTFYTDLKVYKYLLKNGLRSFQREEEKQFFYSI